MPEGEEARPLAYQEKACYPNTMIPSDLMPFWMTLGRPLTRLLFAMCLGLLIANVVEALRWTRPLARLSAPLVRLARHNLGELADRVQEAESKLVVSAKEGE